MRRLPAHAATGLALIAVGVVLALLIERTTGIVLALIGMGFLIPLRPGRRPDASGAVPGTGDGDERRYRRPDRDGSPGPTP